MPFLFAPPAQAVLPIEGEKDLYFPLHRVYHIGHNYAEHNRELSAPDEPVIFLKPVDAVVPMVSGRTAEVPYPPETSNFQHEIELVAALKAGGRNLSAEEARACIYGFGVGIDFTRRDLHLALRGKGQPWEKGKTVDDALPVTELRPIERTPEMDNLEIWLYVNNEKRQSGSTSQMMFPVPELIAHLSKYWELKPGDIVFTGTPAGVGPVQKGDVLKGGISGVGTFELKIV
ncbi:fumarylacetoacetate hydrolase family protein [Mesosutterella sp. AGMB02718]|uniref:Fumarylacetoacetate hydrolase family protein n=1 Tax=Mesosutterella faecium TaxID=2925194 RepID=A0ABT7IQB9_9BURK|nr:fumarylacetoacetate hydrolase family protein [Mesosutterella sp. AGMB02718]MDL2059462.1 fumarylacetoacetate hydrolase family protein [Mesosutterella sp. AGMB02718]